MCSTVTKTHFHTDIQEYSVPSGRIEEKGWDALDSLIAENWYEWHTKSAKTIKLSSYHRPRTARLTEAIGGEWLVKGNGTYVGTFTKRFAKYCWKEYGVKVPSAALENIGNILSPHVNRNAKYRVDFTQDFDWDDGDFGDEGSCYWGSKSEARKLLAHHGAYAVRFYHEEGTNKSHYGRGRAWVAPYKGDWVIFNAYGPYSILEIARLLSQKWGVSYKKVELRNNGTTEGLLYINEGSYLLAPADKVCDLDDHHEIDLCWDESDYCDTCANCRCEIDTEDCQSVDGAYWCKDCYNEAYTGCSRCGESVPQDEVWNCDDDYYCQYCAEQVGYHRCDHCSRIVSEVHSIGGRRSEEWCMSCIEDSGRSHCESCGDYKEDCTEFQGAEYCPDCLDDVAHACDCCDKLTAVAELVAGTDTGQYCSVDCAEGLPCWTAPTARHQ